MRSATIVVEGADVPELDGEYTFVDVMKDAGRYRRHGTLNGTQVDFHIYRCQMQHEYLNWFISATEVGRLPGTSADRDFYSGKSVCDEMAVFGRCLPPQRFAPTGAGREHLLRDAALAISFRFPDDSPFLTSQSSGLEAVPVSSSDDDFDDDDEGYMYGSNNDSSSSLENSGILNNFHNTNFQN